MKKNRQKMLIGCFAAAFTMASSLTPLVALGAETQASTSSMTRLGGVDRYETAAKVADAGWTGTSDYAVLAAGMDDNLVDALSAVPLAKYKNAPILLTTGDQLNPNAEQELTRLKVKTVYVTSGTGVIQQAVLDKLTAMGLTVIPLGGADRFATAVNIAQQLPISGEVAVTTAWSNADALSMASIAAAQGIPILPVDVNSVPSAISTYLAGIKDQVTKTYVLGGTGVVSDALINSLPNPQRLGGVDRFSTNRAILQEFASIVKQGKVFVANGQDGHIVDSLTGSALAAQSGSAVVLADETLPTETRELVKMSYLPNQVVALGGEATVAPAVVSDLGAFTVYSVDGATEGATSTTNLEEIKDNLSITGKNVTLANAQADYSLYVTGDNVTLKNVKVKGTVFVDPGNQGTATLEGVTADAIVVMSGASDSIHISNSTAGSLVVSSDTQTHVVATGTTKVENTVVTSYAILDANGGSLGQVQVTSAPGTDPVVELRGTFTEPIVVTGQTTLKAAASAVVPTVVVQPKSAEQKVTLDGAFKAVEVKTQAKVDLAPNAVVDTMKTDVKATINVPTGASVGTLDFGDSGTLVGGGGKVNGQTTTTTPSTPPPSTGTTPPATGGGGGGSSALTISSVYAQENGQDVSSTGNNVFDFSQATDSQRLTGLKLVAGQNITSPTLVLTSINARNVEWINKSISATADSNGVVTSSELLGGLDQGAAGITFGNLRMLFGTGDVVLTGHISKTGYSDSANLTVTLRLGSVVPSDGVIENQWMKISRVSTVVTVVVKDSNATFSDITNNNFNFSQAATALAVDAKYYNQIDPNTAKDLENRISGMTNEAFGNVSLGLLVGKQIKFGNALQYTVQFVGAN